MSHKFTIAVHGGAGTILRSQLTPEMELQYKKALEEALDKGFQILQNGGSALDAVECAVISLENCPLFNAGKGSVFNSSGQNECDASIMDGKTLAAGAVCAVKNIKNPVTLARAIMEKSECVMMNGVGAYNFAEEHKIEIVPDDYFFTQHRFDQWLEARGTGVVKLDHNIHTEGKKFGTVGAVAIDSEGNLAAATSTGGMTNKKYGRVGDTPIIGAGTYAENGVCAVSCTGHGEYFIKAVTAYDIAAQMKYKNSTLQEAANHTVMKTLVNIGGEGGIIAIDKNGHAVLCFNSEGMYRGVKSSDGTFYTAIYENEV
jgi:beta-aspartyl-peptidase (threonine type)